MTSKRWLIGLSSLVVMLTIAGAVSFVHYVRAHAPQPTLVAVAPFDIFVPGLEQWRVRLARDLTARLDSAPPLTAGSPGLVPAPWGGPKPPEIPAPHPARPPPAGVPALPRPAPVPPRSRSGPE